MSATSPGVALVIGDNEFAALQVVRSLGRRSIAVELVCYSEQPITRSSRYVNAAHLFGHPLKQPAEFDAQLLALLKGKRFEVAIPTSDESLAALMRLRPECETYAAIAAPDQAGYEATSQKHATIAIATRLGIPTPETRVVRSWDEFKSLAYEPSYPIVLKPSCSIRLKQKTRNAVKTVADYEQAAQVLPEMLRHGPVLVQAYCQGRGVGFSVLGKQGELLAAFQHRRVHEPPAGGASSYRASEPLNGELLEYAERFCAALNWTGPAMFEYRRNESSGQHTLMEVNGRLWGSMALAIQAGVDFPYLVYQLYRGERIPPTFTYCTPRYARHTARDAYWLQANLRAPSGRSDVIKVTTAELAREFVNILTLREGYDLESLTDPLPGLKAWGALRRQIVADVLEKIRNHMWRRQYARSVRFARKKLSEAPGKGDRSILFICTGNINRSAAAEQRLIARCRNMAGIEIASAGVDAKVGTPTGEISLEVAQELQIDLSQHRSAQLTPRLLEEFGLIVVMDSEHLRKVTSMNPRLRKKLAPLAAWDPTGDDTEIIDPFGKNRAFYRLTYARIARCVDSLAQQMYGTAALARPACDEALCLERSSC